MTTPRPRLFFLLLQFLLFSVTAIAATDMIDASVESVGVSTSNTVTKKGITLLAENYGPFSIALKDTRYTPVCRWQFPQPLGQPTTAVAKERLTFWIEFFLDNQSLELVRWDLEKGEYFGKKVISTALKDLQMNPGKRTVSCRVSFQYATASDQPDDPNPSNNTKSTLLLVTNDRLDPLFVEEIPSVTATIYPESARFEPDVKLALDIKGSGNPVRDFSSFRDYAKHSAYTEQISYSISRLANGQEVAVGEIRLTEDSPALTFYKGVFVDYDWLEKHSAVPGKYRIQAFLSQKQVGGVVTGPMQKTITEFTLIDATPKPGPVPVSEGPAPSINGAELKPDLVFRPQLNIGNHLMTWDAKVHEVKDSPTLFRIVDPGRISGQETKVHGDWTQPRCKTNIDFIIANNGAVPTGLISIHDIPSGQYDPKTKVQSYSLDAGASLAAGEQRVVTAEILLKTGLNELELGIKTQKNVESDYSNNVAKRFVWLDGNCRTVEALAPPLSQQEMPAAIWSLEQGPGPHVLDTGLSLAFRGYFENAKPIRGLSNFGYFSQHSPLEERFHIVFTRVDSLTGGLKKPPVTVAEITGFVNDYKTAFGQPNTVVINEVLSSERLARYGIGVGKYTAQAWVSQRTDNGLVKGPVSSPIEFTIWDKATAVSKNMGRFAEPTADASSPPVGAKADAANLAPLVTTPLPEPNSPVASARTPAPGSRAMHVQRNELQAPPNPCRITVSYYVPQAPVVSAISTRLLVNDQFQIQCSFKKETRDVEWPECDDTARTSMQVLKLWNEAGGRYSGIVAIDGNNAGVSSSPENGSDFTNTRIWSFEDPGAHEVSCQVDNAFHHAAEGAPTFLNSAVSFDVSARSDGLTFRGFEPESALTHPVRPLPSEDAPTARDGRFRLRDRL